MRACVRGLTHHVLVVEQVHHPGGPLAHQHQVRRRLVEPQQTQSSRLLDAVHGVTVEEQSTVIVIIIIIIATFIMVRQWRKTTAAPLDLSAAVKLLCCCSYRFMMLTDSTDDS